MAAVGGRPGDHSRPQRQRVPGREPVQRVRDRDPTRHTMQRKWVLIRGLWRGKGRREKSRERGRERER